jgi:hypothetical protein
VVAVGLIVVALSGGSDAAIFERYLHAESPSDRAILGYLELEKQGTATSRDLSELGVLLLAKGFPNDAEQYLRKAYKMDKENFEAIYRLGLVLQRQGEHRKAIRCYKKVVKMRPGHAYARFMLALAEEKAGRRSAAIRDYAKAFHFAPDLAVYEKNPLLYDSTLQAEAQLERYRLEVESSTLKVTAIDPAAVERMMAAMPGGAAPASASGTAATPGPQQGDGAQAAAVGATAQPATGSVPVAAAPPPGSAVGGTKTTVQPAPPSPAIQGAPPATGAGQQSRAPSFSRRRDAEPIIPGPSPTPTPTPTPQPPTR